MAIFNVEKPEGQDIIRYAVKVNEEVKDLGKVDKLVKKRKIELEFQKSVKKTMLDKQEDKENKLE